MIFSQYFEIYARFILRKNSDIVSRDFNVYQLCFGPVNRIPQNPKNILKSKFNLKKSLALLRGQAKKIYYILW